MNNLRTFSIATIKSTGEIWVIEYGVDREQTDHNVWQLEDYLNNEQDVAGDVFSFYSIYTTTNAICEKVACTQSDYDHLMEMLEERKKSKSTLPFQTWYYRHMLRHSEKTLESAPIIQHATIHSEAFSDEFLEYLFSDDTQEFD